MNFFLKLNSLLNLKEKKKLLIFIPLTILLIIFETLSIGLIIPLVSSILDTERRFEFSLPIFNFINFFLKEATTKNLLWIFFLSYLIKNIYFILYNLFLFKYSNSVQERLGVTLLTVYLKIPYIDFVDLSSAEILRNIQSECSKIRNAIRYSIIILSEFFILFAIIILIIIAAPKLSVITLFFLLLIVFLYFMIFRKIVSNLGEKNLELSKRVIKIILENISGSKLMRILSIEDNFINNFSNNLKKLLKNNFYYSTISLIPRIWIELFSIGGMCLLLFFLLQTQQDKYHTITYLSLVSFSLIRIIPSIMKIMNSYQEIRYSTASINKIKTDLEKIKMIEKMCKNKKMRTLENKLVFKNIDLVFKNSNKPILKKINLEIKKNEIILIEGLSGSGKTTLVNLISGLYRHDDGTIYLDEEKILPGQLNWAGELGYVTQDTFILDDTIKNNIAYGINDSNIDLEKINKVIDQAQLSGFVKDLANGIETIVGEGGAKISGGQAQRIGIARALYHDPKILIFDEATSSLDKDNEKKIFEILEYMKSKLTIIVISHNPIKFLKFDKIFELVNNDLIEKKSQ